MAKLNPIALLQGDEMAAVVSNAVHKELFSRFPVILVDQSVESRFQSQDKVIEEGANAIFECGAGLKISTASARSKELYGMKSANIVLRPLMKAVAALRVTQAKGRYEKQAGILRFLEGGFYSESDFSVALEDGREIAYLFSPIILWFGFKLKAVGF